MATDRWTKIENRIHTPAWNDAVSACRGALQCPFGDLATVDAWLANQDRDAVLATVDQYYERLRADLHLSLRFRQYFISCVFSHGHAKDIHALPNWLAPPSGMHESGARFDQFVREWYTPHRGPEPVYGLWERVMPPLGFELCWPKLPFLYLVTDEDADVEIPRMQWILNGPGQWSWHIIDNYAIWTGDSIIEGRYMWGPALAGKTPSEFLSLPPGSVPVPTRLTIPAALPPPLALAMSLGPGAVLEWREPYVHRDLGLDKWEKGLADTAEASMERLWLNRTPDPKAAGRPVELRPSPGTSYSQRVIELYTDVLRRERDRPTPKRRGKLRARARRQALREFDGKPRDKLPPRWWDRLD